MPCSGTSQMDRNPMMTQLYMDNPQLQIFHDISHICAYTWLIDGLSLTMPRMPQVTLQSWPSPRLHLGGGRRFRFAGKLGCIVRAAPGCHVEYVATYGNC